MGTASSHRHGVQLAGCARSRQQSARYLQGRDLDRGGRQAFAVFLLGVRGLSGEGVRGKLVMVLQWNLRQPPTKLTGASVQTLLHQEGWVEDMGLSGRAGSSGWRPPAGSARWSPSPSSGGDLQRQAGRHLPSGSLAFYDDFAGGNYVLKVSDGQA